jgi:hypothetical protein
MIFVNRVADFVHRSVSENDGFPNKNVGDAFQAGGAGRGWSGAGRRGREWVGRLDGGRPGRETCGAMGVGVCGDWPCGSHWQWASNWKTKLGAPPWPSVFKSRLRS